MYEGKYNLLFTFTVASVYMIWGKPIEIYQSN